MDQEQIDTLVNQYVSMCNGITVNAVAPYFRYWPASNPSETGR